MNKYKKSFADSKLYSNLKQFSSLELVKESPLSEESKENYFTVKAEVNALKYTVYPVIIK